MLKIDLIKIEERFRLDMKFNDAAIARDEDVHKVKDVETCPSSGVFECRDTSIRASSAAT